MPYNLSIMFTKKYARNTMLLFLIMSNMNEEETFGDKEEIVEDSSSNPWFFLI